MDGFHAFSDAFALDGQWVIFLSIAGHKDPVKAIRARLLTDHRLEAQAKAGFYPTPPEVVEIIQTWIAEKKPGRRRLLDPCCGTGEPATRIANAAGCDAYGVEINTERAQAARTVLNKVICANLFSVRARHEAFSVLYLNPPYDFDAEDGRTELSFLKHTLRYLVPRGLLLFMVPQKRVTSRIARVLAAYIEDPNNSKRSGKS